MGTYLFAWNPKRWTWKDEELAAEIRDVQAKGSSDSRWSCGNRRALPVGSRFFLIRLGQEPRGLVGSGTTASEPTLRPHWDNAQRRMGKVHSSVRIRFDFLSREPLVTWAELQRQPFASMRWGVQASGIALPQDVAMTLEAVWARRTGGDSPILADEVDGTAEYPEGARKRVTVDAFERSPQARAACTAHFGYRCSVCNVLLSDLYGSVANDFIQVHHLLPLAEVSSDHKVNPQRDLRPVCPNCHAIIHRQMPPLSIERARRLVKGKLRVERIG
jgi:5-methylcytosine-specific restriction enzyme A